MPASPAPDLQPSFADLGRPLCDVTFCVVDLETTGGAADDSITEIGAVKVRGGEVLGEFQTLVNPHTHIPALIAVLTGITDQMVADAPSLPGVLPAFLEFASGCVIVAHNARFDTGFLMRACERHGYPWPRPQVLDTVALARQILLRDEVPNCKLATLARHFRATTTPTHRALDDARATVDVLHGLLERVGNLGVHTLEELVEYLHKVSPQRRAKRRWADDLPGGAGVYLFVSDVLDASRAAWDSGQGPRQVLYVGTSRHVRTRVRTYFTAAEKRPRMEEMIRVASGVEAIGCSTPLEAEVLELRLIAAHAPRYNRRSKRPHRYQWLKLTREPFPRLSVVRTVADDGADYFGPFGHRAQIEEVTAALYDAFRLRRCTPRLRPGVVTSECALAGMGRCPAPCSGAIGVEEYGLLAEGVRQALHADVRPVLTAARARLARLVTQQRYEEAAAVRSRLEAFLEVARRHHRLASIASCPQMVAALRRDGGWDIHVIRHGRLAAAAHARPGEVPQAVARVAVATAETVLEPVLPAPAALIEETERIAAWLETPGVRFIDISGDWAWPTHASIAEDALAELLLGQGDRQADAAASAMVRIGA